MKNNYSQNIAISGQVFENDKHYWLDKLDKNTVMSGFPIDQYCDVGIKCEKTVYSSDIPQDICTRIAYIGNKSQYGIFVVLLSGLKYLLYRYTGNEDIVLGMPPFKQNEEKEFISNVLVLRTCIKDDFSFKTLAFEVKNTITEANEHQNYPFYKITQDLGLKQADDRTPLFKTIALSNDIHNKSEVDDMEADVVFVFTSNGESIKLDIEYKPRLYNKETIVRICEHFTRLMRAATQNPNESLCQIDILNEDEKNKLLFEFNKTKAEFPKGKTLHEIFKQRVEEYPDNIALVMGEMQLTYRELNEKVNRLAYILRSNGIKRDSIVAVMLERSMDMVIAALAVLKAGGAYLPIDPEYPGDRISYTLEDSGSKILITQKEYLSCVRFDGVIINIHDGKLCNEDCFKLEGMLENVSEPNDLAYIIYTSGTTGRPKGVMIEHRNVVRLLFNDKIQFDFCSEDTWTMFHSFCFDFSVWEMYGALLYGGKLVIVPKQTAQDPKKYLDLLIREKVTILNQTPTAFYNVSNEETNSTEKRLSLRYVIFGGEALKPIMLKSWRNKYPLVKLINMYGITETTVHVTYKEITEKEIEQNISNIGKPIPTLTTYILDKTMKLVPLGVAGELCVGGDGVGRGYLNRHELTYDKFVQNPYIQGERLYRSGDLARFLPNGDMEYLGRIDHQVKIRGHRIELGEIESLLLKYDNVREALVIDRNDEEGNKYLCAYVVPVSKITIQELRDYLSEKLPAYMIPAYFVELEKIPLTSNGKADRNALPQPQNHINTLTEYIPPRNELEEEIAQVWADVIGIENISVAENFFGIGGDSIKAITLISKINSRLNKNLSIRDIYENQSIRELASIVNESGETLEIDYLAEGLKFIDEFKKKILDDYQQASLLPKDYEDFYPLSHIQIGMVFYSKIRPDEPLYHDHFIYQVRFSCFDIELFGNVLKEISLKHPILRTSFHIEGFNEAIQVVHSELDQKVHFEDLSGLDRESQENCIKSYMQQDLNNKFKFNNDLLWRICLFKTSQDDYCIIVTIYHAIMDGWSVACFSSEMLNLYSNAIQKKKYEVKEMANSYKEYVAMSLSRKLSNSTRLFWKETFKGFERNKLPFNISSKRINNINGIRKHIVMMPEGLLEKLENQTKKYGCTLKDICFAAYIYLLKIITTESEIITGIVSHDRPAIEDGEKILGCFLNTIPVRISVESRTTKEELIEKVKKYLLNAKSNELFLADIASIIGEINNNGNPIFDTIFNFVDFHILRSVQTDGVMERTESNLELDANEMTNTLFDLEVSKTLDVFCAWIKYSPNFFYEKDIKTAMNLYTRILQAFSDDSCTELSLEDILTAQEKKRILYDFNNTVVEYPKEMTLNELFEEQVERTPDNTALVLDDKSMTYRELNKKANQMARLLIDKGVKAGDCVALVVQRGFDMIAGMLGILKCGGAYVPIDPEYPKARKEYIIKNSEVTAILSDDMYDMNLSNIIVLNEYELVEYPEHNIDLVKHIGDLAYIIYTSGSTGSPKGVMIEHHSAVNLISWVNKEFNINQNDSLLFITSMCFDLSVYDIFGILSAGGRVVIAKKSQIQNPKELNDIMIKSNITFWDSVPTTMNYLINHFNESNTGFRYENLRLVFLSGDWIPVKLPMHIKKYFPNTRVISLGGATEGTVWSNYYPIEEINEYQTSIPYGKPIDNNYFYILNQDMTPVPEGVVGELFIGGVGVARGYVNNQEKTDASFVKNIFLGAENERMYRTGDIGRMLPDGNMEFLGRKDHQVKIRGFRVELGEIENQLLKHKHLKEAVVVDKVDSEGGKYLCAYIVSDEVITTAELRDFLLKELPDYMLPSYFLKLDKIPLTSNGKTDRNALPEPEAFSSKDKEYEPPTNEIEIKLMNIWKEVLETKIIGTNDNFFDLGGNSILVVRIHSRLEKAFPGKVSITDIFTYSTIKRMAGFIQGGDECLYKKISFKSLSIPERYFTDDDSKAESTIFKFNLENELVRKIRIIEKDKNIETNDILTSMYIYLFFEITGQAQITVQTALKLLNKVSPMTVNFDNINNLAELVRTVKHKKDTDEDTESYLLKNITSIALEKEKYSIIPLIYRRDLISTNTKLTGIFDMILEIDSEGTDITIMLDYNANRLKKGGIEMIIQGYVNLLELFVKQFESEEISNDEKEIVGL